MVLKIDFVSSGVVAALALACVSLVACPRKPETEVIAANTTTTPTPTPPTATPPAAAEAKGAAAAAVNKAIGKRVPERHREKAVECSREKVAGNAAGREDGPHMNPARPGKCKTDADCTAGKNGRCSMIGGGRLPPYPGCVYDGCYVDADCGAKSACECGGSPSDGHSCEQGNCAVDADCGSGGYCSPSLGGCGNYGGYVGNFCHTPNDECVNDSECGDKPGGYCKYSQEAGKWQCSYGHCVG